MEIKIDIREHRVWFCSFCGSVDVEAKAWIRVNDDNSINEILNDEGYCIECGDYVDIKYSTDYRYNGYYVLDCETENDVNWPYELWKDEEDNEKDNEEENNEKEEEEEKHKPVERAKFKYVNLSDLSGSSTATSSVVICSTQKNKSKIVNVENEINEKEKDDDAVVYKLPWELENE